MQSQSLPHCLRQRFNIKHNNAFPLEDVPLKGAQQPLVT